MAADSIGGGQNMVSTVLPHSDVPNLAWVCWLGSERLLRDRDLDQKWHEGTSGLLCMAVA